VKAVDSYEYIGTFFRSGEQAEQEANNNQHYIPQNRALKFIVMRTSGETCLTKSSLQVISRGKNINENIAGMKEIKIVIKFQ
jgi:hypothetical protein